MGQLGFLNEAAVLFNMKKRYYVDLFHTYSGLFLVVVNPYKRLPIYTEEMINIYRGKKRNKVAPHIFAMADTAYRDMLQQSKNQSMLITGESGAGKTENTKKVIQYLTAIAGKSGDTVLEEQLLQFNPILEAFGNAKTTKNDNSSRFGKFIELQFNSGGQISGANTLIYLLEKSRVVFQGPNERNFHVFYQILSRGLDADAKKQLNLTRAEDYIFLNKSGCVSVEGMDDAKEFGASVTALDTLGVSSQERFGIFEVLSGILHLGNLPFTETKRGLASLKDDKAVGIAAMQLGVTTDGLKNGLLRPSIVVPKAGKSERVSRALNKSKAINTRDALCKALYGRLFNWIVRKINECLSHKDETMYTIGVLDISGFEIFQKNSFEQLCINYTNEKLQQFFNHHMFTLEQEEYEREKIEWTFVDYGLDSQDTIDLIEKPPSGILYILNDESVFPDATDETFTKKLHAKHQSHRSFRKPRFDGNTFKIVHYAGQVEYDTDEWLEKNRDPLEKDLETLMKESDKFFVKDLFDQSLTPAHQKVGGQTKKSVKRGDKSSQFITVSVQYKDQLNKLMTALRATSPHFIRCIIPNLQKRPGLITDSLVLEQLKCNGVLEGIRIARKGWPNRIKYPEFVKLYHILLPVQSKATGEKEQTKELIEYLVSKFPKKITKERIRFGLTKIFFRAGQLARIEQMREDIIGKMLVSVQAAVRAFLARREYGKTRDRTKSAIIVQRNVRAWLEIRNWGWWKLFSKALPLATQPNFQEDIDDLEKSIKDLQEAIKGAAAKRDALLTELNETKEDFNMDLEDLEKVKAKVTAAEAERDELKSKRDALKKEVEALGAQMDAQSGTVNDLMQERQTFQASKNDVLQSVDDAKFQIAELNAAIQKANQDVEDTKEKYEESSLARDSLNGKITDLEAKLREAEGKLLDNNSIGGTLRGTLKDKERALATATAEYEKEQSTKVALEAAINDLNDAIATSAKNIGDAKAQKELAIAQVKKAQQKLDNTEAEIAALQAKAAKIDSEGKTLRTNIEDLEDQLSVRDTVASKKRQMEERITELEAAIRSLENKKNAADLAAKALKTQLEETNRQVDEAEATANRLRAETKTAVADLEEQLETEKENAARDKRRLQKKIKQLQEQIENAPVGRGDSEELRNLQSQFDGLQEEIVVAELAKYKAERLQSHSSIELEDIKQRLEAANRKSAALQRQNQKLTAEVEEANELLTSQEEGKAKAQATNSKLSEDAEELRKKYNDAVANVSIGAGQLENTKRENRALRSETASLDRANRALERELSQLQDKIKDAKYDLDQQRNARVKLSSTMSAVKGSFLSQEENTYTQLSKIRTDQEESKKALADKLEKLRAANAALTEKINASKK
eukprot:TRINITY_DN2743_c0_g1_i1.p1 TRINITY_DN2743_c0_g1~~TRINITY_DN2743_c0_g1_i1.p1  ORF type:complete len:1470 (-),score=356.83 TRINITY_DN2743_c0_g1_i1:46-4158(-)